MNYHSLAILGGLLLTTTRVEAQTVLFDFDSAPLHSGLPLSLTVSGITAQFSATGQGFSIQSANSLGFTPAGFTGNCIYPNSVYAADLLVSFSTTLTTFSILYAPEEYACDSSATMRITAYMDASLVGTATTNAAAGTWPSEMLQFSSSQGFNRVVIHYDAPPATGGDWGPIFMADNMAVTPAPAPIVITSAMTLSNGAFQVTFTNVPSATFSVLAALTPALPLVDWTLLGGASEVSPGQYQFTDLQATNSSLRFYRIHSP